MSYPSSFSDELRTHCEGGCVPPEVFEDIRRSQPERGRYVRVHALFIGALLRSGDETLLGYRHHMLEGESPAREGQSPLGLPQAWSARVSQIRNADVVGAGFTLRERVKCGLQRQLGLSFSDVLEVPWLSCLCYRLPHHLPMASNPLFQNGTLIPMDAASLASVVALRPRCGECVLDMCCSPGMKLNCLADALTPLPTAGYSAAGCDRSVSLEGSGESAAGIVVGVDISVDRQYVARAVALKHADVFRRSGMAPPCVALFAGDGCTFSVDRATSVLDTRDGPIKLLPNGVTAREKRDLQVHARRKRKRCHADDDDDSRTHDVLPVFCPEQARRLLCARCQTGAASRGFDRVLVDAECTHDGSLAHVSLGDGSATDTEADAGAKDAGGLTNQYRMQRMNLTNQEPGAGASDSSSSLGGVRLLQLQLRLLESGFAQLREGGTLVYSTCSFSFLQNEYVVWRFLCELNARLAADPDATFRAVPVAPFSYAHERCGVPNRRHSCSDNISCFTPCGDNEDELAVLQRELDAHAMDYGVRAEGIKRYCNGHEDARVADYITGSRLWPHVQRTSFQFIAKIWKQPLKSPSSTLSTA